MSRPETTRQIMIEKAAAVFNEKGVAGTSVDDILKAAKVAKASLYSHFESKDELSYASVDYMFGRMVERRIATQAQYKTAKDKIYAFMQNFKNPIHSHFDGGCPVVNFCTESDDTNPVIKKKVRAMIENSINFLTGVLQQGIDSGELSDKLDPADFASRLFISIEGANAICRVLDSVKPMHNIQKSFKNELENYILRS